MGTHKHLIDGKEVFCSSELWYQYRTADTAYEGALLNKNFAQMQEISARLYYFRQLIQRSTDNLKNPENTAQSTDQNTQKSTKSRKKTTQKAKNNGGYFKYCKNCGAKIGFITMPNGQPRPVNFGTEEAHRGCIKAE